MPSRLLTALFAIACTAFLVDCASEAAPSSTKSKASTSSSKQSDEDRAIELVAKQKEVKSWSDSLIKSHAHPAFSADKQSPGVYSVHVFEDLPDHTATFGYYDVNLKTGKVSKQPL